MTTLFLATTGGHLEQLESLAGRIRDRGRELWVTHSNEQSRSLLRDRDVEFVPYVRVRHAADVARCVPTAHRLWKERGITRVVSTGSGIALGYLPYLAARGVGCHYIESAARVCAPSLTGKLLQGVPRIHRYTQYRSWAGGRWDFIGSVFDDFRAVARAPSAQGPIRVVVTVGTAAEFPFDRLLHQLVGLLGDDGELQRATGRPVEALWQIGCAKTGGLPACAVPYLGARELVDAMEAADIVISHAGTGSALAALTAGRFPVLVPRSAALGEAGDDHQGELAEELQERGLAIHRDAESVTVEVLAGAMGISVRRHEHPPALDLKP